MTEQTPAKGLGLSHLLARFMNHAACSWGNLQNLPQSKMHGPLHLEICWLGNSLEGAYPSQHILSK